MADNLIEILGDLTKPATVLVEKVSDAVGGLFKPHQIVVVAKAEAEADRIRAESQIQIADTERRAMRRFLVEEARNQLNMEEITKLALPGLDENSHPENVEDDWITNFFDKCRIVSDAEMQKLWSGVLAGEANSPGSFSKQTVNLLNDLDKNDAELFVQLRGFCWKSRTLVLLVYDLQEEIYNRRGLNFNSLSHLDSLGLIRFDVPSQIQFLGLPKKVRFQYYEKVLVLTFRNDENNRLATGHVSFTRAGEQLALICDSPLIEGFYEYVKGRWAEDARILEVETEQRTPADG